VEIDPSRTDSTAVYKLLISSVVPRPIAWVSTVDPLGVRNVAPFSFFMAITDDPPTIAFSSSPRPAAPGEGPGPTSSAPRPKKDTLQNAEATGSFVVNVVDDALAEQMNVTSGEYGPDVDEFALAALEAAPSVKVAAPRVARAPIAMECQLIRTIPVGNRPHHLVLGEIVYFHVRDDLYDARTGRLDMHRLRPVGRLAGNLYTRVHDIFEMVRPAADYRG
jgi:flavin reductase (DIM6/NTAB) family NADH-FMN oxidoreductase RutF